MTRSVLFACNLNSVRSPIAAALLKAAAGDRLQVESAGVYEGGLDPFVKIVLGEIGIGLEDYEPRAMNALDLAKFDLVIALTPQAAAEARRHLPRESIEFWDIENPSDARGGREEMLAAYRAVREDLAARIRARFADIYQKP